MEGAKKGQNNRGKRGERERKDEGRRCKKRPGMEEKDGDEGRKKKKREGKGKEVLVDHLLKQSRGRCGPLIDRTTYEQRPEFFCQNSCRSRYSGVHLVFEVFSVTRHSDKGNPSVREPPDVGLAPTGVWRGPSIPHCNWRTLPSSQSRALSPPSPSSSPHPLWLFWQCSGTGWPRLLWGEGS